MLTSEVFLYLFVIMKYVSLRNITPLLLLQNACRFTFTTFTNSICIAQYRQVL